MPARRWLTPLLLAGALTSGCAGGEARGVAPRSTSASAARAPLAAPPRVVPRGTGDDALLEAADWRLEGFPAVSRDGRHVATVLVPSSGYRAIVDEAEPNFDEPSAVVEFPNSFFVVVDARTGAMERRQLLVDAGELRAAQEQRSKPALAARVRSRLAAMERVLAAGGYTRMPSVRLEGRASVDVGGAQVRVTAGHLSVTDGSGRSRLEVPLDGWRGQPLPMGHGFTCLYTARVEEVALDLARGIAAFLVAQDTNGGDACAGAANADRTLRVLRLGA